MREINPIQPKPETPGEDDVVIWHDARFDRYEVAMPRAGRLGSRVLLDEHGEPASIGPGDGEAPRWASPKEAIAHFRRVADKLEKMSCD